MPSSDLEAIRKSRREWYHRNKDHAKSEVSRRRKEMKAWYTEYRATLYCQECGENHPATLDFHHRDPDRKEINLSSCVANGWSKERILAEIDKCDVMCSNCHRKLHYKMRP